MTDSDSLQRAREGLLEFDRALDREGLASNLVQELIDIGQHLLRGSSDESTTVRIISHDGDKLAALRHRIDQRIADLPTGFAEDQTDPLLGLIADLIFYRVELWTTPIEYSLSDAEDVLSAVAGEIPVGEFIFEGDVGEIPALSPQQVVNIFVGGGAA